VEQAARGPNPKWQTFFCGKVIEIQVFTSEVSEYMFLGSVNMNMWFTKQ